MGELTGFLQSTGYGEQYSYDKAGNMTRKVITPSHRASEETKTVTLKMSYNKGNQLTGMANGKDKIAYRYDKNGSMVQKALSSKTYGKLTDTYAYNALDQLTSYTGYDGYQQTYTYDANGMRLSKAEAGDGERSTLEELLRGNIAGLPEIVEPALTQTNEDETDGVPAELEWATTEYLYDITQEYYQVIAETSTGKSGSTTTAYAYGLERIAAYTEGQTTRYVYDGRGSVAQTIRVPVAGENVASALPNVSVKVASFSYTAFGEQMGGTKVSGFGYNAEAFDAATGMLNLRARQYEPVMNRFSQKDAIKGKQTNPATLNHYSFVNNCPMVFADASGQSSIWAKLGNAFGKVINTIGKFVSKIPIVRGVVKVASSFVKSAVTYAKNATTTVLQSIVNSFTPDKDPSGRSAMIIAQMQQQLAEEERQGRLSVDRKNQILFSACQALLNKGSATVQSMHNDMQYYISQGTTVEDLILYQRYSKEEMFEYIDWFYAGNREYRDALKQRIEISIRDYYGNENEYKQQQLLHALQKEYDQEIALSILTFLLSFTPLDELVDAIQVGNDLLHGDVTGALLDGIGFIPIVEGVKYIDDIAGLIKSGKKITIVLENGKEITGTVKDLSKALDNLPSGTKILDDAGNLLGVAGKYGDDVIDSGASLIKTSDRIIFGSSTKSTEKIFRQMEQRGWTEDAVRKTVDYPHTKRVSTNKATGNTATVYYTATGSYVIVDDVTNEIVQISDNINPSTWVPDASIIDPYLP